MAKPNRTRTLLLALCFLLTFLGGTSMGYWYIFNKTLQVNCNFNLLAPPLQRFGT